MRPIISIVIAIGLSAGAGCRRPSAAMLASEDGTLQVAALHGWKIDVSNKNPQRLKITLPTKGCFVFFVAVAKKDTDVDLRHWAENRRDKLLTILNDSSAGSMTSSLIDDYPALQCEFRGTAKADGLDLKYLLTAFETPTRYVQCLGWSVASRYDVARPEIDLVRDNFRDTAGR